MVPFMLVLRVAFPSLLFLGCMSVFSVLPVAGQCPCRGPILWCYDRCSFHSVPPSSPSLCLGEFPSVLWCQCWIHCLCIPDMSMVVLAHLPHGVRGSIVFPRQFLPSGSWLRRTTSSTSQFTFAQYTTLLCCVIRLMLLNLDIWSSIGSLNWQYWLMM